VTGVRRLLALISIAMVAEMAASSAITPLLPHLADEHGLSKADAGVLAAAYPGGTLVLSLPGAWLSARIGARTTVIGALLVLALASLAFGFASSTGLLIGARFLQGAAAASVWAGGLAWVVAAAPRERRAEAIGAVIGAAIAGALGGPAIGAAADAAGMELVFGLFGRFVVALAAAVARRPGPEPVPVPGLRALRAAVAEPLMRRGMWLMALGALAFGVFNVLLPLRLDELGAGAITIGAVFLLAVVGESVMSPLVGRIADRRGAVWPSRIGLAGGGLTLALLPAPRTVVLVAGVLVVTCALLGMLWAPAMETVTEAAELRGIDVAFGFGLANLAYGAGATLGGSGGGALAEATVDAVPYLAVAVACLLTAAALRSAAPVTVRS
jgi:MFS family permease